MENLFSIFIVTGVLVFCIIATVAMVADFMSESSSIETSGFSDDVWENIHQNIQNVAKKHEDE